MAKKSKADKQQTIASADEVQHFTPNAETLSAMAEADTVTEGRFATGQALIEALETEAGGLKPPYAAKEQSAKKASSRINEKEIVKAVDEKIDEFEPVRVVDDTRDFYYFEDYKFRVVRVNTEVLPNVHKETFEVSYRELGTSKKRSPWILIETINYDDVRLRHPKDVIGNYLFDKLLVHKEEMSLPKKICKADKKTGR